MAETTNQSRVIYGLTNVHYAMWDDATSTYATPKRIYGAVSLSTSPEGDSSTFYADNTPYFVVNTNAGWTGDLEVAAAEQDFLAEALGWTKDSNGMLIETTDAKPKTFALMFEVESNTKDIRTVFYNCTLTRPETEANTTTDTTDPDTQTMSITMIARNFEFGACVKGSLELDQTTKTAYDAFYNSVLTPSVVSS